MLGLGAVAGQALDAVPGGGITFVLTADFGTFILTGEASTFSTVLQAGQGAYSLSGQPAGGTFQILASTGIFNLSGFEISGAFSVVQTSMKVVQDQWDVDEWGRFYRGGGMRYTL